MGTWVDTKLPDEMCEKCGAEYEVFHKSLPLKDKDSFTCICGSVMREWKETGMYTYRLIELGR